MSCLPLTVLSLSLHDNLDGREVDVLLGLDEAAAAFGRHVAGLCSGSCGRHCKAEQGKGQPHGGGGPSKASGTGHGSQGRW